MTWRPARPLLQVLLAAAALGAVDLGRRVLVSNDEARFAVIARGMLERGEWLSPTVNGVPYYNKPPLAAALIGLASWPGGQVTQLTSVLPSALAGMATVLIVYALGRHMFGTDAGRAGALVAVTSLGLFVHERLPLPDVLLACFVTASVWMLWPLARGRPGPYWLGFYGFAGLAFWVKGPVAVLPLVVALAWLALMRRPELWRRLQPLRGAALLAAIVAPWYVLGIAADPAAMRRALVVDQLFWYLPRPSTLALLPHVLRHAASVLFPWVLILPVVLWQAVRFLRGRGTERDAVLLLLVWGAVVLGTLALSNQQRLRYYVPLVAPAALLVGWWVHGATVRYRRLPPIPRRVYGVTGAVALVALAGALATRAVASRPADAALPASVAELVLHGAALALMTAALVYGVGRRGRGFMVAWAASAIVVAVGYHAYVERLNAAYDYTVVHDRMRAVLAGRPRVVVWGLHDLPLSFYFGEPVVGVKSEADLERALAGQSRAVVILAGGRRDRLTDALPVLLTDRLASRAITVVGLGAGLPAAPGGDAEADSPWADGRSPKPAGPR